MAFSNRWVLADGTLHDDPITIRYREEVDQYRQSGQFPHCIQIEWEAEDVDATTGYPSEQELIKIDEFNKKLMAAVEAEPCGIVVMILMAQGVNQWIMQVSDNEKLQQALDTIPTDTGLYPIQVTTEEDQDWDTFTQLRDAIQPAPQD